MSELSKRELAIKEAVEVAENTCRAAFDDTEQRYWKYLQLLPQNKRVGGPKDDPWYASIKLPYIKVDGRVRMAQDEHREKGEKLEIQTGFSEIAGFPHFYAHVESGIYGSATAHARVFVNGIGVDKTNPVENAETSAVGRALGFFGYGLLGSGIASADEVLGAQTEGEAKGSSRKVAEVTDESFMSKQPVQPVQEGDWNAPGNLADQARSQERREWYSRERAGEVKQMSDKQANFLYSLLENLGVEASDTRALVAAVYKNGLTSGMASGEINDLKEAKALPREWVNAYVKMLEDRAGATADDIKGYTRERYGEELVSSLAGEEQKELFAWLREDDIAF